MSGKLIPVVPIRAIALADIRRVVLANDISASACEAMRMNVTYNDAGKAAKPVVEKLSPEEQAMNAENGDIEGTGTDGGADSGSRRRPGCEGFVYVNESDAWSVSTPRRSGSDADEVARSCTNTVFRPSGSMWWI